ncbi:rho GTPase-activating protein 35-like [Lingula anatina]|uniref:Rho GTPase-activating protein 35-like n=1 Tax=Lingula anatina TaxID=7574 RepID=A0A1S3JZW0_LINAN|nr:rho GTPase-activating protein 35-like [Lingula anatina]|eukprot:XP_013415832.1 rho GTPase-activating protein 35-like [Lingula anatina]
MKMSLDDYLQGDAILPMFVEKCIVYIEENGLGSEGLYRVPGNKAHVELLLQKFNEDHTLVFTDLEISVNDVATAVKTFFRELQEPLIPNKLNNEFISAAGIHDKTRRLQALREVLQKLPAGNYRVLKFIATHLNKVTTLSDVNCMTSTNLAICWWPTLLRPEFASLTDMASSAGSLQAVVQTIIDHHGFFFE